MQGKRAMASADWREQKYPELLELRREAMGPGPVRQLPSREAATNKPDVPNAPDVLGVVQGRGKGGRWSKLRDFLLLRLAITPEQIESIVILVSFFWGFSFLRSGHLFNLPVFRFFNNSYLDETQQGLVFLFFGLFSLCAALTKDARARIPAMIAQVGLWLYVLITMGRAIPENPSLIFHTMLILFSIYASVKMSLNYRSIVMADILSLYKDSKKGNKGSARN